MRGSRTAKTRHVRCTHCGGANEVARRAMSVFCARCFKRLILEDYVIRSYQGLKGYSTCGDVVVEKSGRVSAPIQANSLIVKGVVRGTIEARGRVEVAATGSLVGDVFARSLSVSRGGKFSGYCRIGPPASSADAAPSADLAGNCRGRLPAERTRC